MEADESSDESESELDEKGKMIKCLKSQKLSMGGRLFNTVVLLITPPFSFEIPFFNMMLLFFFPVLEYAAFVVLSHMLSPSN